MSAAAVGPETPPAPIIVTAVAGEARVSAPATGLDEEQLAARQPITVGDALRTLPGVSARTNSRGETIARVRGSEERQTQVFLDGAPLAVPWDGRADIGMLPAALFGEVAVVKGIAPIEYGANAVAGVVDLRTRTGAEPLLHSIGRIGPHGLGEASVVGGTPIGGDFSVLAAVAGLTRDAFPDARRSGGRLNTDLDSIVLLGALQYQGGDFAGRTLLLHNNARRGIAPETTADPSLVNPRFWRYPDIALTQLIAGGELRIGSDAALRFTGWRQWFGMTIDQYANATYTTRSLSERDRDGTFGGRVTLAAAAGLLHLRLNATAQTSLHRQVDTPFPSAIAGPELHYRQNLLSLGAEADVPLGGAGATFGIAYDRAETPLTGDKPAQPPLDALAFSTAVRLPIADELRLVLSGGRRTRFPTARELFGEALGRFLLNPDLRPETAWLADAELSWSRPGLRLVVNPFLARGRDTLSQRVLVVGGRSLRQRFNLSGSWSYGVDAELTASLGERLAVELFASLLRARADAGSGGPRRLVQRPSFEIGAALDYRPTAALALRAELRHVGEATDLSRSGNVVRLEPGTQLDLRASHRVARFGTGPALFATAALDNATDATITPQLGLPLPGRTWRIGLRLQ